MDEHAQLDAAAKQGKEHLPPDAAIQADASGRAMSWADGSSDQLRALDTAPPEPLDPAGGPASPQQGHARASLHSDFPPSPLLSVPPHPIMSSADGPNWGPDSEARLYPPEELDTEFKRKYPPDKFGDEAADSARVWKVFCDEASENDKTQLNAWNKTLDILLIFAGLFSAVSTAFIIESYKMLQPDYTQYLAGAVYLALAARNGSNSFILDDPALRAPSDFVSSSPSHWINGLWLTSLTLSLSVALLCILAKQWLDEYHSRVNSPAESARSWARRRTMYYNGIQAWQLPALLSTLPVLLHVSLFLFFAGLVVFVWQMHLAIAVWLFVLSTLVVLFYLGSIIAPLKVMACPSATPLTRLVVYALRRLNDFILRRADLLMQRFRFSRHRSYAIRRLLSWNIGRSRRTAYAYSETEEPVLDADALTWLINASPSLDVVAVGIQAIGAFLPWSAVYARLHLRDIASSVVAHVRTRFPVGSALYSPATAAREGITIPLHYHADIARYIRAMCQLCITETTTSDPRSYFFAQEVGRLGNLATRVATQSNSNGAYDLRLLAEIADRFELSSAWNLPDPTRLSRHRTCTRFLVLYMPHSCSISNVLHTFDEHCLNVLSHPDLICLIRRVQVVLQSHRITVPEALTCVPACIELWSAVLNRKVELDLGLTEVNVAVHMLGKFIKHLLTNRDCALYSCDDNRDYTLFPEFLHLCASQLDGLCSDPLRELAVSMFEHVCVRASFDRNSTPPQTKEFWLAYIGLIRVAFGSVTPPSGTFSPDGFAGVPEAVMSICRPFHPSYWTVTQSVLHLPANLEPPHLPHILLLLQPDGFSGSAWRVMYGDETTPCPTYFRSHYLNMDSMVDLTSIGFVDGARVTLANALAAHLCRLRRAGVNVTAFVEEFLAPPLQHWMRFLTQSAKSSTFRCEATPFQQVFEHLIGCCMELSPTWWANLHRAAITDEFRSDKDATTYEEVTTYADALDQKLQNWTPCVKCQ